MLNNNTENNQGKPKISEFYYQGGYYAIERKEDIELKLIYITKGEKDEFLIVEYYNKIKSTNVITRFSDIVNIYIQFKDVLLISSYYASKNLLKDTLYLPKIFMSGLEEIKNQKEEEFLKFITFMDKLVLLQKDMEEKESLSQHYYIETCPGSKLHKLLITYDFATIYKTNYESQFKKLNYYRNSYTLTEFLDFFKNTKSENNLEHRENSINEYTITLFKEQKENKEQKDQFIKEYKEEKRKEKKI